MEINGIKTNVYFPEIIMVLSWHLLIFLPLSPKRNGLQKSSHSFT